MNKTLQRTRQVLEFIHKNIV